MYKTTPAIMLLLCSLLLRAQDGPQLPGMGFDQWTRNGSTWYPYSERTPEGRRVWDSSNKGMSPLGVNSTEPDFEHLAVPGKGKAAAKIRSRKILWAFVTGNLMTGRFARVVKLSGAEMYFGVPFSARPKSLSGWYHYVPGIIDYAKDPYKKMMGKKDKGRIEVILTDWKEPYHIITTEERFMVADGDPHVIGRAELVPDRDTGGYLHFDIPINYTSDATPTYVVITAISSIYGEYFTGSSNSVLWVDDFKFNY